jgi:hypothetical protein
MPKIELLPGVADASCPPDVVCDPREELRRARRRALVRDVFQLALLFAVDALFYEWPNTRVPMLDRENSVLLVCSVSAMIVTHVALSRILPRMSARRIATTWSRAEQRRFERW